MKRSVTIIRPGPVDAFGDHTAPSTEMSDTCLWVIGIVSSDDDQNGKQNRVSSRVTCYPLGETIVRAGDLVRVNGFTWQVDGNPARCESPFTGRFPGYEVNLKAYEG